MRLLVTGKSGQVGWELQRSLQCLGEVLAVDRSEFDLAAPASLPARLDALAPDVIVNAAAYTAVDLAEREESLALAVNGDAPGAMARWAATRGALLIHYSTDYVFDGSGDRPWRPEDPAAPLSAYGRTKLAGEHAIVAAGGRHLILRTSWVYASRGKNFLATVRRLAAEREELRIVADQVGAPTPARLIADATAHALHRAISESHGGTFQSAVLHLTAAGATSWHGFASAIVEHLRRRSGSALRCRKVTAITSAEYPTPARRPGNSRLECSGFEARFGVALPSWRDGLRLCVDELGD
jgi:dTDP-4-dehydrorhamnose reductase